ncbi:MAG: hypothetical protein U5K69_19925 [Balneolaceae bacterium]|nr:hypothetical protein [Balneolaceae bacterium]
MTHLNTSVIQKVCLVFLLLCTGLISGALAQQPNIDQLIQTGIENGMSKSALTELQARAQKRGMSPDQLAGIIQPAVGLAEQNLPANHLILKALEGMSKGVPVPQIIPVVDRLNRSTQQAAQVVDPWIKNQNVQDMLSRTEMAPGSDQFRRQMIEASSRAISQNIPASSLSEILQEVTTTSISTRANALDVVAAINILPDLAANQTPEAAQNFVVRALKGGFGSRELQKLPMAVSMAQKRSQIPAASILEGISKQLQAGTPAAQVLQNLFKGNIGGGPPGNIPGGPPENPGQGKGQGRGN